jgi:hypothetical protein
VFIIYYFKLNPKTLSNNSSLQKAYANLREALLLELSSEMPRETMQYRGIRDRVVVARTGDSLNNGWCCFVFNIIYFILDSPATTK